MQGDGLRDRRDRLERTGDPCGKQQAGNGSYASSAARFWLTGRMTEAGMPARAAPGMEWCMPK